MHAERGEDRVAEEPFRCRAVAADAADAVACALRERPELALLDTRMPGSGAAAAWEALAADVPLLLLTPSAARSLGEVPVRTLEPTELFALKVVAAKDRRGSEKGAKDLADLLALLSAEGRSIAWDRMEDRVSRKDLRDVLRTALSDYRTTSRLYPLPMRDYRALKRSLERIGLL